MLPEFDEDGDLPAGIHAATLAEIEGRFGRFTVSDRRVRLFVRLRQIAELAWSSGIVERVLVAGSFITAKPEPNDVDLVLLISSEIELDDLTPSQYAMTNRRALRRIVKQSDYDATIVRAGAEDEREAMEFFQETRSGKKVGIVEVKQ